MLVEKLPRVLILPAVFGELDLALVRFMDLPYHANLCQSISTLSLVRRHP